MKIRRFFFGRLKHRKKACLFLKIKHSNIELTITDLKKKVVVCRTPASCGLKITKRRKKAPHSVEPLVNNIILFFKRFDIRFVHLIIRNKITRHVRFLIKELLFYNLKVKSFTVLKKKSHNGLRGRKLRRI